MVRRYLSATNAFNPKFWIANWPTGHPDADASQYFSAQNCYSANWAEVAPGFSSSNSGTYIKGAYLTGDGNVFAVAGSGADGSLMQYYPEVRVPTTSVRRVSVAQSVITNVILAGRNNQGTRTC